MIPFVGSATDTLDNQVSQTGGKADGSVDADRLGPLDLGKGNGAEPILNFRPGALRGGSVCPDQQDRPLFKLHLQFSIQAGITVIFHFSAKSLIRVSTAKVAANNRALDFMPPAGPVFHNAPPFVRP